jgi:DNA-binding MarR family transcriptional regulator/GNAT superfamily N-acetyltransferase
MTLVDEVRGFNRFYTREIGLLNRHLPASDLSLAEARVLYELAHRDDLRAADIVRLLRMDKAHVSRIIARFRRRGLVQRRRSPDHGKWLLLSLTAKGRRIFAAADAGSQQQIEAILRPVDEAGRRRLALAMRDIEAALGDRRAAGGDVRLRKPAPGDLGWITHRQAVLYHREYGWDWSYEALVAEILARFIAEFDPSREDCWIAERAGAVIGSIFLVKGGDASVGKLRLLYVEPNARGLGIGTRLVAACVERARELGYRKLTLWTNDILVAARRIYQAAGFELDGERPHHSFGHDLVAQTWSLDLTRPSGREPPASLALPKPKAPRRGARKAAARRG